MAFEHQLDMGQNGPSPADFSRPDDTKYLGCIPLHRLFDLPPFLHYTQHIPRLSNAFTPRA